MEKLKTKYMGLKLENPIVISSSGLTSNIDSIKKCEEYGAGAVVLKSIFEEQILAETEKNILEYETPYNDEAMNYIKRMSFEHTIEDYINLVDEAKKSCKIPIISSINLGTEKGWLDIAKELENIGSDAIEFNIFIIPDNINENANDFEKRYLKILNLAKKNLKIPIAIKLTPYFTNLLNFVKKLSDEGSDAIVLFNRFQTININKEENENPQLEEGKWLSLRNEKDYVNRWICELFGRIRSDLSASSGIRTGKDVLEAILFGASIVQIASAIYLNGYSYIKSIIEELNNELTNYKGSLLMELKGLNSLELNQTINKVDRLGYFKVISALNKIRKTK